MGKVIAGWKSVEWWHHSVDGCAWMFSILIRLYPRFFLIRIIIISLTRVSASLYLSPLASDASFAFWGKVLEKPKKLGHQQNQRLKPGTPAIWTGQSSVLAVPSAYWSRLDSVGSQSWLHIQITFNKCWCLRFTPGDAAFLAWNMAWVIEYSKVQLENHSDRGWEPLR